MKWLVNPNFEHKQKDVDFPQFRENQNYKSLSKFI